MFSGATPKAGGALSKKVALELAGTERARGPAITRASRMRKIPIPRTRPTDTIRPSGAAASSSGVGARVIALTLPTPW